MPLPSLSNILKKDQTPEIAESEIQAAPVASTEEAPEKYVPDSEAQEGVKKVEAITLSWSCTELIIAYIS